MCSLPVHYVHQHAQKTLNAPKVVCFDNKAVCCVCFHQVADINVVHFTESVCSGLCFASGGFKGGQNISKQPNDPMKSHRQRGVVSLMKRSYYHIAGSVISLCLWVFSQQCLDVQLASLFVLSSFHPQT